MSYANMLGFYFPSRKSYFKSSTQFPDILHYVVFQTAVLAPPLQLQRGVRKVPRAWELRRVAVWREMPVQTRREAKTGGDTI